MTQLGEDLKLLRVEGLAKHFPQRPNALLGRVDRWVRALDGVSFDMRAGEALGVVGESGCGKTTLVRTLLRLEEPTAGAAYYEGRDIFAMSRTELRALRRRVQVVFQNPYASLDPRMRVREIIEEAWRIHPDLVPRRHWAQRTAELLHDVGLSPSAAERYPHQFSGGQRQRVALVRALALEPQILLCDEPVSALDVSVQAQVLNLLDDLRRDRGIALMLISHDLAVVRHVCSRVAVMYLGTLVEIGEEQAVYDHAAHPYTQALLSAVPVADPSLRSQVRRIVLEGEVPSAADPPSGCRFRTRCFKAQELCSREEPLLVDHGDDGHLAACHFVEEIDARTTMPQGGRP